MKYSKTISDVILAAVIALACGAVAWVGYQFWLWMATWEIGSYRLLLLAGIPVSNLVTFVITRQYFAVQVQQHHKGLETGVTAVGQAAATTVDLRGQMHRQVREVWRPTDQLQLPPIPSAVMLDVTSDDGDADL